jgi:leucyl-tRNA synthetase
MVVVPKISSLHFFWCSQTYCLKSTPPLQVNYKLRDWLFARQRYWGEPFPLLLLENGEVKAVPESDLPVTLPEIDEFTPTGTGEPPLAKATSWVKFLLLF